MSNDSVDVLEQAFNREVPATASVPLMSND
jgi:hypothetical protein